MSESEFETGEGSVSADTDPSSAFASRRHLLPQGEKEGSEPICPSGKSSSRGAAAVSIPSRKKIPLLPSGKSLI
jgi:hypothetical protein